MNRFRFYYNTIPEEALEQEPGPFKIPIIVVIAHGLSKKLFSITDAVIQNKDTLQPEPGLSNESILEANHSPYRRLSNSTPLTPLEKK